MKKTISLSDYNALFQAAENSLQNSWADLGLSTQEIIQRANQNPELQKRAAAGTLSPCYHLYKKNANEIVDEILKLLDIEVQP